MGYFPNSTAGEQYERKWCFRCANAPRLESAEIDMEKTCPILDIHLFYNYEQNSNEDLRIVMNMLIPTEGTGNGQCAIFTEERVACKND